MVISVQTKKGTSFLRLVQCTIIRCCSMPQAAGKCRHGTEMLETGLKHTYTWIAEQVKAQMKEGTSIAEP